MQSVFSRQIRLSDRHREERSHLIQRWQTSLPGFKPGNGCRLCSACHAAQRVIVAWGNGGRWQGRDRAFLELWPNHQSLYCLGLTQQGQPRHPLYVRHNTVPVRWLDAQECNPVSANGKSAHRSHSHD